MTKSHLPFKRTLALFLVLLQSLPLQAFAIGIDKKPAQKSTVAFVPLGNAAEPETLAINKEVAIALRNQLKSTFNILEIQNTQQILKSTVPAKASQDKYPSNPQAAQAISLIRDGRDAYNLNRNTQAALQKLDDGIAYIKNQVEPSRKSSELLLSALTNKAWILYREGRSQEAVAIITAIYLVSPKVEINLKGYPTTFRAFTQTRGQAPSGAASLNIGTNPNSVEVLINGIYVGASPLTIHLPAGAYELALSAPGRKPYRKKVTLKAAGAQTLTASLGWGKNKAQKNEADLLAASGSVNKLAYLSQIGAATHADKAVLFDFIPSGNGYIPQVIVYDSKYNQALKPILYKKVANLRSSAGEIVNHFANKLGPYLSNDAAKLYQKDFDKTLILDQRLANRPQQSLFKKPGFLAALGAAVIGGTVLAIVLANGSSSASSGSGSGGIGINLPGQ